MAPCTTIPHACRFWDLHYRNWHIQQSQRQWKYIVSYLNIQLSRNDIGQLNFTIYKKLGKLVKDLNIHSHNHKHHKTAVLLGMELHLALLTTLSNDNASMHEALSITRQIKAGQKMRTLCKVLGDKSWSGPAQLEKQLRSIDKRDSFSIVKYANFGKSQQPINQVICCLQHEFWLKWLCLRDVYSWRSNLQEKIVDDLNYCGVSWTPILVIAHATSRISTRSTRNVCMVVRPHHAKLPLPSIRSCVKLTIATVLYWKISVLRQNPCTRAYRWG